MATFEVTAPDGTKYRVKGPDGASKQDAIDQVRARGVSDSVGKIPSQESGTTESFLTGIQDPLVGGKQLLTHAFGDVKDVEKIDAEVRQREQDIARSGVNPVTRGVGSMVSTVPLMAAGAAGLPGAIAGGAVSGALQPVTDPRFGPAKAGETAFGAITGAAGTLGGKAVGAAVAPQMTAEAQALSQSGVSVTPGQALGGFARSLEEGMKRIPILNNFVRDAEKRSVGSFNTSVLDQVLEPIGGSLNPGTEAGHAAVKQAHQKISNAYDTVLPNFTLTLDQKLARDIATVRLNNTLTPDREKQFDKIITNRLKSLFQKQGPTLTGEQLKGVESDLRVEADKYRNSLDGDQRTLAGTLDNVRGALHDSLIRQNPNNGDLLKKIDTSYAMWIRANGAAQRRATSEGVFTPNDLLQTIKTQDKSAGKRQFAQGDALLQTYAETAQKVLPSKIADSGTPERLRAFDIPSAAIGSAAIPLYTPGGVSAFSQYAQPGAVRQGARSVARRAGPYLGIGSAPSLMDVLTQQQDNQ